MKKLCCLAILAILTIPAMGQKMLTDRFNPDGDGKAFIAKGSRALGISGNYMNFNAGGDLNGDGYQILSLLNVGDGQLHSWKVMPKFAWFPADDFAIEAKLIYSGYSLDTDINLDFRTILQTEDPELNVQLSSRHMVNHSGGFAVAGRKYIPFFGSKFFAIFGGVTLEGRYSSIYSSPREEKPAKYRISHGIHADLSLDGGLALRLKDGSLISAGIPLVGIDYDYTFQNQYLDENVRKAHMSSLRFSRKANFLSVFFSYSRFILPKKKR